MKSVKEKNQKLEKLFLRLQNNLIIDLLICYLNILKNNTFDLIAFASRCKP